VRSFWRKEGKPGGAVSPPDYPCPVVYHSWGSIHEYKNSF